MRFSHAGPEKASLAPGPAPGDAFGGREGPMHRLYDYLASGNGYKVRLILRLLGIPFERIEVDIVRGESRTAEWPEEKRALLEQKRALGVLALSVMENHLEGRAYFVADRFTVADIALYAYTHVAPEGGFDLAPLPRVRAWLDRVRDRPGFTPITQA